MYLPTFYKLQHELLSIRLRRYASWGIPIAMWGVWSFWPSIYNMIYTDFIPPERGVKRRLAEE